MQNNDYNDIGLFKFQIIAPAINKTHGFSCNEEYFKNMANKTYTFNNKEYHFSKSCIKHWYLTYKNKGYQSLEKKKRSDYKSSRKLSNDVIQRMITIREKYLSITGTMIYKKLIDEKYINKLDVSIDTILRFLRNNNLKASQTVHIERRMFEMEHVNDCCYTNFFKIPTFMIKSLFYKELLSN